MITLPDQNTKQLNDICIHLETIPIYHNGQKWYIKIAVCMLAHAEVR